MFLCQYIESIDYVKDATVVGYPQYIISGAHNNTVHVNLDYRGVN